MASGNTSNGSTWSDTETGATRISTCTSLSEAGSSANVDAAAFDSLERPATPSQREALAAHPVQPLPLPVRASTDLPDKRPASSYLSSGSSMSYDVEAKGEAAAPLDWKPTKNELLVMISLSFISLMVALDATVLVTVLPVRTPRDRWAPVVNVGQEIAQALDGTSAEAFWAGTSYLLTSAIFQPVIASISSNFGRQQMLLLSLTFFTVGTILCSVAHDFTVLLTGRSIQGIGGGGIITITQVIFCDIVPLRQRPKYFAMVLGSWSIGSIVGPVVGGSLVENASWRWCFHINYPFCGIGFIVAGWFVRMNATAQLTILQKLKQTDWLGALLFIGSFTSFLIGLSFGGVQHPWTSAATLAPIIVGTAGIGAFLGWQMYRKPYSLLPMSIFYNWSAISAFYCAVVNGLVLFTALYYIPFFFMTVRGSSPTSAGIDLFPAVCFLIPGSIVVAVLTARLGRFRWAIWLGWAITTIACGLFIIFGLHTRLVVIAVALAMFGIGSGMVLTSVNVGIQAISKVEDCAMAASMYGFFRSLGMPIGVALSGTVFQNAMSSKLLALGLPTQIAHDSEQYVFRLRVMAEGAEKTAILESYMHGFNSVFIFMTAISASALIASFVIRKFSMDKILLTAYSVRE
ncbi:major facilitator superfamily domain-containing protein [Boeremia exigua]|uniref:major facilitator superfamily domain-containing protein n=1 Tax=Boeremia exigua TaxID=749465 RepID=UPI001E8D4848|nr:major facilitator superfamily domain-containing protein [Boeremia exigua]KAH6611981.1 major facilitator superfamily domain-containing protein [Boeremia exigua]